jgi:hypothetical protein
MTTITKSVTATGTLEERLSTFDVARAILGDIEATRSELDSFGFAEEEAARMLGVALRVYKTCVETSFSMEALIEGYIEDPGPRPNCTDNCHEGEDSPDIIRHLMRTMRLAPTCDLMAPMRRFLLQYYRMPTKEELEAFVLQRTDGRFTAAR